MRRSTSSAIIATVHRPEDIVVAVESVLRSTYSNYEVHIIDQSTNGTFLQNIMGQETYVRRDSTELASEGSIGLGRAEEPGSTLAIHYKTIE